MNVYDFTVKNIKGEDVKLSDYKGKTLLIVNTASKCGLTPQFEGLEDLYKKYKDQNFEILGFPCNQFLNQDPGSESEILEFCSVNYGVSFPMFSKIDVNGDDAHELFKFLKDSLPGFMGSKAIKWNFTKFLIDKEGRPIKRFAPKDEPKNFEGEIKKSF